MGKEILAFRDNKVKKNKFYRNKDDDIGKLIVSNKVLTDKNN